MKKVAIYGQSYAVDAECEIHKLLDVLYQHQTTVFLEKKFHDLLLKNNSIAQTYKTFEHFKDLNTSFDMLFTIGGDGTFLRAISFVRDLNIPILGINTGRLGFLATVKKDAISEAMSLLFQKSYELQERTLLEIQTIPQQQEIFETPYALNELTVSRKNSTAMIGVKTVLNGENLNKVILSGLYYLDVPLAINDAVTGIIELEGEVVVPGKYSFTRSEKLEKDEERVI